MRISIIKIALLLIGLALIVFVVPALNKAALEEYKAGQERCAALKLDYDYGKGSKK